jgi:MoaA/NifB/PqqE/SkfB family radical SAM enzyme
MQGEAADIAGEDSHQTKGLLRLTMACNERCPFCNVPAEDYARLTPPQDEIDAELQQFLDAGARTLTLSGGEPTLLRKRLLDVCRRARAGGVEFIELQTNAVLIDADYARAMAEAGVTSAFVSFLSHVPEHHDTLAGLPGAWPKCLAGIDNLLDAGVRVTLNPVTARLTQSLVPDLIDFVAARLPRVRFISMSAVQPHGRARRDLDLMPEYDVLADAIREARRRATAHGIELVNPYCGLPLCVGWDDALDRSVEAFEARQGGWRETPGLDNVGNKAHGAPCRRCALRSRCGGAWHAYWELRGGAGLRPPVAIVEPWHPSADAAPGQVVLRDGFDGRADAPTVWWHTRALTLAQVPALLQSAVTDLALELHSVDPAELKAPLQAARRVIAAGVGVDPQVRLAVWVAICPPAGAAPAAVARAASLALALGVDAARVMGDDPRWPRLVELLREQHPGADLAAVPTPSPTDP